MSLREEQEKVQKAMNATLSGLREDPWLTQRVLANAKGEEPVKKKRSLSLVLSVVMGIAIIGTAVAAAIQTDFFAHVFGNETREDTPAHTETLEDGKGGNYAYTFPARDFTAVDPELAEGLTGGRVMGEPVTAQMKDHTVTVLSAVRDRNAMVMEMTVECPGGVRALRCDGLSNETKGAAFDENSGMFFMVDGAAEMIYVDARNSTDTCLRIYYYCVFYEPLPDGQEPVLLVGTADPEQPAESREYTVEEIGIPAVRAVETRTFAADNGESIELSPFSLKIVKNAEPRTGGAIVLPDLDELKAIEIVGADGERYAVLEEEKTDNTMYLCGGLGESASDTTMVLNRLVDPDAVRCVRVNGTEYTPGR